MNIFPVVCELPDLDEEVGYGPMPDEDGADEVVRGILCAVSSRPGQRLL